MDLIKKFSNKFFMLLEDFGRAKAAAALARQGYYDQAREIIVGQKVRQN